MENPSLSPVLGSLPISATMADKEVKYITAEDLKKHNKRGDLWISIQGKVYDVSNWLADHPGGESPLINFAGEDVTDAFMAYHPAKAWIHLEKFFTGYRLKDPHISEISSDYRNLLTHFSKLGLFEKKGHGVMISMIMVTIMLAICVYGVVFCSRRSIHLASGALLGLIWIQSAYMGHDSGHYRIMSSDGFNKLAQLVTGNCLTGISIAWWKWTHNAHHIAVNSLDHDPDLQHIPVFAVSSKLFDSITSVFYGRKLHFDPIARFLISYQHWTFYPVTILARLNLYIQTFLLLVSNRKIPNRMLNILGILVFWIWFPILVSFLPGWGERLMFVGICFTVTSIQHVQFCLNHFGANVYVGKPAGNDWFEKQTKGTIDISCSSWMDWFFGGLQFQLEHHLFPRLPRCHLRRVSPLVVELCKKHGLPYRSLSFWDANVVTIKTLRAAALQARDVGNPIGKNLLWEAVNTHG